MSRIDVHQHILPPGYVKWLHSMNVLEAGGRDLPDWSAAGAIDLMDKYDIESAVLSVSTPGAYLGDGHDAATVARMVNESSAECVKDHAGRFGFFATLPLPDVDASAAEITYAYDELGADGVILLANANGAYLGDPAFDPLMTELNARSAVIFVHPHVLPGPSVPGTLRLRGLPAFAADFLLDTTRAGTLCRDTTATVRHHRRPVELLLRHRAFEQSRRTAQFACLRQARPRHVRHGLAVRARDGHGRLHRHARQLRAS